VDTIDYLRAEDPVSDPISDEKNTQIRIQGNFKMAQLDFSSIQILTYNQKIQDFFLNEGKSKLKKKNIVSDRIQILSSELNH